MRGLSLDQAPPLSVVLPFFVAGALSAAAAGGLLAADGSAALTMPLAPTTLGATHLITIGLLMLVMMGALYPMIPVVLGVPVPWIRLSHGVFVMVGAGVGLLVAGLTNSRADLVAAAMVGLGLGVACFLPPAAWAAFRSPAKTPTAWGIRFALLSLAAVVLLGLLMARGHAGSVFPGDRWLFVRVHVALGVLGWIGSLIVAVSWQVVPMFYLAKEVPGWQRYSVLGALVLGVGLPPLGLLLAPWLGSALTEAAVTYGASPALFALFVAHPWVTLKSIRDRRRKRAHPSVLFFRCGLATAPLVGGAAILASISDEPRWDLLYGFLALVGWAAMIVHGMLSRIVPFLVWFHRFSPLAGLQPIPSMNALLPARWTRVGLGLHAGAVGLGAVGILTGHDFAMRGAGALLAGTGLSLAAMIVHVALQRPASPAANLDLGS